MKKRDWDIVSIQHGTGDKSRYTSPESYINLLPLIEYIRATYEKPVKIAFNMAWVADPDSVHHEIRSYNGDQDTMYRNVTAVTSEVVAPLVDILSPAGTAIQNLRTATDRKLTRDGFHLSYDLGRYTASLTFLKKLCDLDLSKVSWMPEGVSEEERELAKKAAELAIAKPFSVTDMK